MKFTVQGGNVRTDFHRPERKLCKALAELPTSIISDCLERLNIFSPEIKPLLHAASFAGPAFTVEEIEGGNLMSHLGLKYVRRGDVLVIDGKGVVGRSCWGGLQMFSAMHKGLAAVIVDGAIRDLDDVGKYKVPIYARGVSPAGPHKGWGGRVNHPVSCGGVVVCPGDIIAGDKDGLVVIPADRAQDILQAAETKQDLERSWFQAVERGEDTADFLGFMDLARKYNISFTSSE
jgi:regulator of RNase E activity RraA